MDSSIHDNTGALSMTDLGRCSEGKVVESMVMSCGPIKTVEVPAKVTMSLTMGKLQKKSIEHTTRARSHAKES